MEIPEGLKLVVFDLDFTLWDAGGLWCDCLRPPFSKRGSGVFDADSRQVRLYEDVESILDLLDERGLPMGLASRTGQPGWAKRLLGLLGVGSRWAFEEIYPSSKVRHFEALKASSQIEYDRMLFFDDEMRNVEEVGELGVKVVHVRGGLSLQTFKDGLSLFG